MCLITSEKYTRSLVSLSCLRAVASRHGRVTSESLHTFPPFCSPCKLKTPSEFVVFDFISTILTNGGHVIDDFGFAPQSSVILSERTVAKSVFSGCISRAKKRRRKKHNEINKNAKTISRKYECKLSQLLFHAAVVAKILRRHKQLIIILVRFHAQARIRPAFFFFFGGGGHQPNARTATR